MLILGGFLEEQRPPLDSSVCHSFALKDTGRPTVEVVVVVIIVVVVAVVAVVKNCDQSTTLNATKNNMLSGRSK